MAGPLLAFEQGSRIVWVHDGCAAASSEVRVLDDAWFHVHAAISRGRRIQCAACGLKGATLGCISSECPHSYHGRCAALHQKWDLRLHRPLGYPKRSKHACIESDSSDDEVDERFPAFSCLACRPPLPKLKPYAQHCTAPSLDGGLRSSGSASEAMQRPLGAPRNRRPSRRRRPDVRGASPSPRRAASTSPAEGARVGAGAGAVAASAAAAAAGLGDEAAVICCAFYRRPLLHLHTNYSSEQAPFASLAKRFQLTCSGFEHQGRAARSLPPPRASCGAEFTECGVGVRVERSRINPLHPERDIMTLSKNTSRHGQHFAHQRLDFLVAL